MVHEIYQVDRLPVSQNRMYNTAEAAQNCPRGDMCLVQNHDTGLIYNAAFQPDLMVYDANYQNEQALSRLFSRHLESVAQIVECTIGCEELVEVGCGKGTFLEMLAKRGCEITGFDPTYEGANPRVKRHYFEAGVGITARGIILRHVLEHVQKPLQFLHNLKDANNGQGLIYIEVPCFDWISKHRAWFDIFYEHVNYFRLSDFHRMFGRIVAYGRLFGDQYLYVVADLATLNYPQASPADLITLPSDFAAGISAKYADEENAVVWGGGSKGVIFALLRARIGRPVSRVIDINPAKQGKYLPATGLRVDSPEDALASLPLGSTIYVMNSNYLREIREMTNNDYRYIRVDHD
jgi:SAM-dependent methyltransferase